MRGNNMRTIDKNTIQSYQDHIYTQEKSKNTIDKYIRDIRTFTAWLQTQEQKDITKECVIRYKKHLEAKYMPSSANSMLIALNGFFGYTGWHDCFVTIFKTQPNHIYAQDRRREHPQVSERHKDRKIRMMEIQTLQFFDMVFLCGRHVDPCGIDAAVSEDIRKVADVFMYAVVGARKEMAEVMWECFFQCNACFFGVFFHFRPDVAAVYRVSVFCDEDCAASDALLFAVVEQFHFQFVYEIDLTVFSFAGYADLSGAHCLHRDRCKFTDAHAGAADDLDDHGKAEVAILFCSCDEFFRIRRASSLFPAHRCGLAGS
jgi:hypothetical protein